jgi:hypothetical protein
MSVLRKEKIKDRMVHTVARLWEVEESEIEHNFDPLMLLLIEACAAELEKIGNDISESHSRLLDYLAEIVLPESIFHTVPASGVAQALPQEARTDINPFSTFLVSQKIMRPERNTQELVDIHLSPTGNFKLLKAELAYIFTGNKLFQVRSQSSRDNLFSAEKVNDSNALWFAIKTDKGLQSLEGLSIYFDMRSHSLAENYYHSLSYMRCSINGQPLEMRHGFFDPSDVTVDHKAIMADGESRIDKINRKLNIISQRRFITVIDKKKLESGTVPGEWKEIISDKICEQLESEKLTFIKIEFPQYFPPEVFETLGCAVNAFPVLNKKFNSFSYKTDEWLNIVPVPSDITFLDLASVKNEKGDSYKMRTSAGRGGPQAGEVIVRKSGVGSVNSAEVREMINSITETIRDQSAYFGQMSNEFILGRLREIGKMLAGLEDSIEGAADKKADHHYLMLRPKKKGEMLNVEYWTTNGVDANSIKAGEPMQSTGNVAVDSKKSYTISAFTGGKNSISKTEKKLILRQQLMSGGKIISAEDVKLLCMQLYGDKLKKVEVSKGVQVSAKKEEGFTKTIDVSIWYNNNVNESMKTELDNLYHELGFILESNASPVYPFRVKIMNAS